MSDQIQYYAEKLECETDPSDLHADLAKGERIVVVDARAPERWRAERIPGAVNMPHRLMTVESTRGLDQSALYVVYCDGIGCNASTKGALNLARLGFKVKELVGGLEWWKRDDYPVEGDRAAGDRSTAGFAPR